MPYFYGRLIVRCIKCDSVEFISAPYDKVMLYHTCKKSARECFPNLLSEGHKRIEMSLCKKCFKEVNMR